MTTEERGVVVIGAIAVVVGATMVVATAGWLVELYVIAGCAVVAAGLWLLGRRR